MLRLIVALCFLIPLLAHAKDKICLNMIVKNESRVIKRCLDSVIPVIDYWVIVDTGSNDGTQQIIKEHLKNIPGELHERSWRNFGENRSEAFNLAKGKGDYILFMDADDTLEFADKIEFPPLKEDMYLMVRGSKEFNYLKPQIARGNLPWKWVGVTHEYLSCDTPFTTAVIAHVKYISGDGGASTYDPEKFLKNVRLLTEGLKQEPDNSRYMFYLAESYRDAGEIGKALETYQKRVEMGNWEEEVFWSKLQIGLMLHRMGIPLNVVAEAYKEAHAYRPHRAEPIYYLSEIYNQQGNHAEAYAWLKEYYAIPKPEERDSLFNIAWMDEYGLNFQLSICSYYLGHYQESIEACDDLIACESLPESWRNQAEINRTFPVAKLQAQLAKSKKSIHK